MVRERRGLLRRAARREIEALKGIDLTVERGEFVALLGRNGAGKTTLLKILATLLLPSAGEVWIAGLDALRQPAQVRRLLGVVLAGERTLYWKLTARENLLLFGSLHDMARRHARLRSEELLGVVGLSGYADVAVEKFSTGMRKRLAIARALMHRPALLILDEPTTGLDPHGVEDVWGVLRALRDEGTTVLMATHNMLEAERIPTRLLLIDEGRLIADGAPQQVVTRAGAERVAVLTTNGKPPADHGFPVELLDSGQWAVVVPFGRLPSALSRFQQDGVNVVGVEVKESGLWEAFLRLTGRPFDDRDGDQG